MKKEVKIISVVLLVVGAVATIIYKIKPRGKAC